MQTTGISRAISVLLTLIVGLAVLVDSAAFPARARALGAAIDVLTFADNTTTDGLCSLREAITNANDNAITYSDCNSGVGADVIVFSNELGTGTVTLSSELPENTDIDGLTIDGGGDITISGQNLYRIIVNSGTGLTLTGLTLANGAAPASNGGGVYNDGGRLTITNSTFSGNSADRAGGAIYNSGTLDITYSTFIGNSALTYGGAVHNLGPMTITHSTFSGNSASVDGGGVNNNGTLTITGSTFEGNQANAGAGVFNYVGNRLVIADSTFSSNQAPAEGAGSLNDGGTLLIINSTFSSNNSGDAADVYNNGVLILTNTILANTAGGSNCVNTGLVGGNNNLIEGTGASACGLVNGASGNIIGTDPGLGVLTGSPAYYPLNFASPAINTGDDATCAAAPVSNGSQNGLARPQGPHCDIGSFERGVTAQYFYSRGVEDGWILESSETSGVGGTLNSAATTLRVGDDAANKQYRTILSFDTSGVPHGAAIQMVVLWLRPYSTPVGTNPFSILGNLLVDVRTGPFGGNAALQVGDFNARASANLVGTFNRTPFGGWYSATLNAVGLSKINLTGLTQFRLRFGLDDNNNHAADYIRFLSGDSSPYQPRLVITYALP